MGPSFRRPSTASSSEVTAISQRYIDSIYRCDHAVVSASSHVCLAGPCGVVDNRPHMDAAAVSRVDYSLARRAVLREYHSGQISRFEICDAHPDLLRAARYSGEKTPSACPVCDGGPVALVSYAFSDAFPKRENGKV